MPDSQLPNSDTVSSTEDEITNLPMEEDPEPQEPTREELPKYLRILQVLEDVVRDGINLDPTGESRAIVVAVTTTNGKIYEIIADSTDDQRFKGEQIWSKIYVEAEVTKVTAPVANNNLAQSTKSPV